VITECGSHDELVAAGGTYAEMYRIQAARFAQ
jgi:ABC-type multidrug transport system fused ATPase/permease subunit